MRCLMKISLIFMAVLLAVVPVLGLSAPSASAEEVLSYPETINQGDTLYFNPNLVVSSVPSGSIRYSDSSGVPNFSISFSSPSSGDYEFLVGTVSLQRSLSGGAIRSDFYFYTIDSSFVGLNLSSFSDGYPDYVFQESDLGRPIYLIDSYLYSSSSIPLAQNTLSLDSVVFSLDPNAFLPTTEDSFVGVWGETAEFVGDIFIQVGDLFYDDTADEFTPIGSLAVILAGIAVVLLVWNLIRSFLPMRG